MLELSGFMLDDLALTFAARMTAAPYALIHRDGNAWRVSAAGAPPEAARSPGPCAQAHLLLRRKGTGFVILRTHLPPSP